MPKIKLSGLVSDIKGSANGSVFARNSGGLYFRNQPSKKPKQTAKAVRSQIKWGALASKWRTLTNEQRTAWNQSVSSFPKKNVWGDDRKRSGFELFMQLNRLRLTANAGILLVPPTPKGMPQFNEPFVATPNVFMNTANIYLKWGAGIPNRFNYSLASYSAWGFSSNPLKNSPSVNLKEFNKNEIWENVDKQLEGYGSPVIIPTNGEDSAFLVRGQFSTFKQSGVKASELPTGYVKDDVTGQVIPLSGFGNTNVNTWIYMFSNNGEDYFLDLQYSDGTVMAHKRYKIPKCFSYPAFSLYIAVDFTKTDASFCMINNSVAELEVDVLIALEDLPSSWNLGMLPRIQGVDPNTGEVVTVVRNAIAGQDIVFSKADPNKLDNFVDIMGYNTGAYNYNLFLTPMMEDGYISYGSVNIKESVKIPFFGGIKNAFMEAPIQKTPFLCLLDFVAPDEDILYVFSVVPPSSPGLTSGGHRYQTFYKTPSEKFCTFCFAKALESQFGEFIKNSQILLSFKAIRISTGETSGDIPLPLATAGPTYTSSTERSGCPHVGGDCQNQHVTCCPGEVCMNDNCIGVPYNPAYINSGNNEDGGETPPPEPQVKFKPGSELSRSVN